MVAIASTNLAFPSDLYEPLERQAAAMKRFQMDYSELKAGEGVSSHYLGPTMYSLRFDANHFKIRVEELDGSDQSRIIHEDAFDGETFYSGDTYRPLSENRPATLTTYSPGDATDEEELREIFSAYSSYLETAGFYLPLRILDLNGFRALQSLVLHEANEGDSTKVERVGGQIRISVHTLDPLVLRARSIDLGNFRKGMELRRFPATTILENISAMKEMQDMDKWHTVIFTLDPTRGYAVLARDDFAPTGQMAVHVETEQWKYFETVGVWLPGKCVKSYYTGRFLYSGFSNQPRSTVTYELKRVEFGIQKNEPFTVNYRTPRATVIDRSTPGALKTPGHIIVYTVSPDGTLLRNAAGVVVKDMGQKRRFVWIAIFSVLLCIPPFAWIRLRNGKK
jgi:hypothetical protein